MAYLFYSQHMWAEGIPISAPKEKCIDYKYFTCEICEEEAIAVPDSTSKYPRIAHSSLTGFRSSCFPFFISGKHRNLNSQNTFMKLPSQRLQALIIPFLVSVAPPQNDPLINRGGEKVVDIGVSLLAVALIIVVWKLSPRVEHAIIFALALSITLIAFFLIR